MSARQRPFHHFAWAFLALNIAATATAVAGDVYMCTYPSPNATDEALARLEAIDTLRAGILRIPSVTLGVHDSASAADTAVGCSHWANKTRCGNGCRSTGSFRPWRSKR